MSTSRSPAPRRPCASAIPVLPLVGSTIVAAGLERPVALGGVDHRDPDPVLDRAARVQVLELGDDLGAEAVAEPAQRDQRRVPPTTAEASAASALLPLAAVSSESGHGGHGTEWRRCDGYAARRELRSKRRGVARDREIPMTNSPPTPAFSRSPARRLPRVLGLAACGGGDERPARPPDDGDRRHRGASTTRATPTRATCPVTRARCARVQPGAAPGPHDAAEPDPIAGPVRDRRARQSVSDEELRRRSPRPHNPASRLRI